MMSALTETSLLDRAVAYLRDYDVDGVASFYRAEVLLDANVPHWRFQLQGPAAIAEELRDQLAQLGTIEVVASSTHRCADGLVVELEVHARADGVERLWHEVHLLLGDDGGIVEHRLYCTGIWDAETIERHRVEGTMVRR